MTPPPPPRRRRISERCALLVVDKPTGMTSHDVVRKARWLLHESRIGHAGTLDPAASGILVLLIGKATRLAEFLTGHDKEYEATLRLGIETATYDADGMVTAEREVSISRERFEAALTAFRGEIEQRPPAYSAVRVEGKRAHRLARKGIPMELAARRVVIHQLDVTDFAPPLVALRVKCSAGTYIRSLAHDLGRALGCGAHVASLRRIRSGALGLEHAHTLADLELALPRDAPREVADSLLLPIGIGVPDLPEIRVDDTLVEYVCHGHSLPLPPDFPPAEWCRIHGPNQELLAIAEVKPTGVAHPRRVLR
jgi:tRNA pseudouridine55 synthase